MLSTKLSVRCFAKINTFLKVLGRRPDGYHNIYTHFLSIDLHDVLHLRTAGEGIEFSCDIDDLPADESNLVVKAATLYLKTRSWEPGLELGLEKRIPVAAGLGGGSSDAAATLLALNRLNPQPLESQALSTLAAELGSDVPYFLLGGHAVGTGRGEVLQTAPDPPEMTLLLLYPRIKIEAAQAYKDFQLTSGAQFSNIGPARLDRSGEGNMPSPWYNDLEKGVFARHPELERLKKLLKKKGALEVVLSGSGTTIAARFAESGSAETVASRIGNGEFDVILTKSITADQFRDRFIIYENEAV